MNGMKAASRNLLIGFLALGLSGCGAVVVENDFNSGGADASGDYPVGETVVTFTATDSSGNTSTCTGTITVIDDVPPRITTMPADVTVECDQPTDPAATGEA